MRTIEAERLDGVGLSRVELRMANLLPYTILKLLSFQDRHESNDVYDLIFCLLNYGSRPDAVGREAAQSPIVNHERVLGAKDTLERLIELIETIPPEARQSLTWDQGREIAYWADLEEAVGIKVYIAEPHSPWQRPVNENFNGLLRRWLPKGSDLSIYDQDDLNRISHQINTMPRRSLDWESALVCYHRDVVALTG